MDGFEVGVADRGCLEQEWCDGERCSRASGPRKQLVQKNMIGADLMVSIAVANLWTSISRLAVSMFLFIPQRCY